MVTKGIDIGDQREGQREDLGDKNNDLDDQRKYLNESKVAMPQRVKQTGWEKPNQPAGPVLLSRQSSFHGSQAVMAVKLSWQSSSQGIQAVQEVKLLR